MSAVRFTSAQLAEQAVAAAHRCTSGSVASSSTSCCWLGESGKDGSESSLSSAGSLSDEKEGCDDDDQWDEDDGGEIVDERFLDPESPLGRAIEIIGRVTNLSSVPAQFVHRLDPDWLARADGFAEHCCERLWTLEALRDSDRLGTYSTHLSDGTLDYYHRFRGERAQDATPYHVHEASIRQRQVTSSAEEELTAGTAAAAEEVPRPTPRPGPPRLGRPSNSSRGSQFFEASAGLLTQIRAPPAAVSARMPTPRRRPPVSVSPPAATTGGDDDDDSRSPASMPESARQELYELYQYTSNGSRARHASSGGGGDRATETDSLASGLQQIDLDPLRLGDTMESSPGDQDEANEAVREFWYEEEEIVEEAEEELAEEDLHEHLQRCDDFEAEAAERERDQSEQARRQRSGGPVGR